MRRATRKHILSVSPKHFADRGYVGTSMQESAEEARVSEPMPAILVALFESNQRSFS
jgi:AcrR family transcriptional regulator